MSQVVVDFIANLLPLYISESVDGVRCARSLDDGSLICPPENPQDEFAIVYWQGDRTRKTDVQAVYLASLAVAKYVALHHTATNAKDTQEEMRRLSEHFTFKTGEALAFEAPLPELWGLVGRAIGKIGEETLMELLKKQIGL
jgi:hypothetical protein